MKNLLLAFVLCFSVVGCEPPKPVPATIIDVYREFKLGSSDGTTIVETADGHRYRLNGRLGKKGEVINVEGMMPVR